ncbi:hypothetical protein D9M73_270070 [compost metagenome]
MSEYSFTSRKIQLYISTITRPMGQHQGFCLTVSQTASTPRLAATSSRGDTLSIPWRKAADCSGSLRFRLGYG